MTDSGTRDNFFNAAKRLIDSEIELVKIVESSRRTSQRTVEGERTMSRAGRNNKQADKPVTKNSKVKASAALVAAKREAVQKKQSQSKKLDNFFICDIYQTAIEARKMLRGQTGLTYDRSMAEHRCIWDKNHPECPERFTRIMERCEELGLVERCKFVEPRIARNEEILMKHTQSQIDVLAATDGCEDTEALEKLASRYDAIYVHPSTYKLSLLATGSTINLLEKICRGEVQNGMAIIRPPGHHAMKSEYCGYCFFNNVAIGAEKMLRNNIARKILIVDWDVHHGQATQQMFYDDPRVVYFSIHRYENGEFWPNLKESDYHYVGANDGAGYNFNVPLNKNGMTNGDYLAIFQQVLLPMAYEFQPDLVIVSAGFDCAIGCPEGEMEVTPGFFAHLLSPLMALANGRVAVVLEGGYCLDSLSEAAALTLRTLLGDPCPPYQNLQSPSEVMRDTILNVIYAHKAYWKCFQYQEAYSINSESDNHEGNTRHLPVVVYKGDETKPSHYETRDCYPVQSETVLRHLKNRLNALKKVTNLSKAPSRVSIVYDERMLKHRDTTDASHPEKPDRISSIFAKHEEYQLLNRCHVLKGREATEEELLLAHTGSHVNDMRQTCSAKPGELRKKGGKMNSVFLHADTWSSACVAVGSVLRVVDGVLNGESQSGVAIVRPPGHHADDETACGFCIFNNIAVAARYATQFHHLKRVLIVDWDIHHGNGTQTILADDPKILYVSIHRYDNAGFFPNSKEANYTFVGTGPGEGYTVNIPWNRKRMGDAEYIAAFQQIVMPIAYQFNPELVLISAGFDACVGDPLGGYNVSPEAYGHLTHWLSSLANGRVVIALEGGYNVNSISYAMTMCTKALLGDPMPSLGPYQPPCPSAITTIQNVLKVQKQYWPNLSFQVALPRENVLPEARITRAEKGVDLASPLPETKIAFDEIENEKIEISMRERQRLETITAEEMVELQREIERMAIVEATKECVNPSQKNLNDGKHGGGAGPSGDGRNEEQGEAAGGATNTSLLDYLSDNMQALVQGEMFAVVPLRDCPHLDTVADVPRNGIDVQDPCQECGSTAENWICLRCYTVHCARSVNQHAITHGQMFEHPLTLSFSDLSVWCYGCEAYIDNPRLFAARNAAHLSKFNHELPWTYDEDSARARE